MPNLNRIRTARVKLVEAHTLFPQGVVEAAGGASGKSAQTFRQAGAGTFNKELYHMAGGVTADSQASISIDTNRLFAMPFFVGGNDLNIDRIAFRVSTGGAAGSVARVGIYDVTSDIDIYPANLIVDGGEQDTTTAAVKIATISETLLANSMYWFVLLVGVASPTVRCFDEDSCFIIGTDNTFTSVPYGGVREDFGYAALPDPFDSDAPLLVNATIYMPVIAVRAAI